jgi:hypothetical protein
MQFMGNMELCTQVGSERWYVPLTTGGWNTASYRGVTTGSNASPREGVLLAFGRAYGNASNGMVMYEAGHDLTGGGGGAVLPHKVSAQRAYFNYLLLAGKERRLNISATFPTAVEQGQTYAVSATTSSGTAPFTYMWTSSLGGSFADPTAPSTNYTAPVVTKDTTDVIRVTVTDLCGKITFEHTLVPLTVGTLPVRLLYFNAEVDKKLVTLNWATGSEINNMHFTIYRSTDGVVYDELARVPGRGTTSMPQYYSHVDETAPNGRIYYRLTQTDYDGTLKSFDPIAVWKSDDRDFIHATVSPNPFTKDFTLMIYSPHSQNLNITLQGMNRRILETTTVKAIKGINHYHNLFTADIAPGLYIAWIKPENSQPLAVKLVKK